MSGYGGTPHEELGHKQILYTTQFTIPNMAGMSLDPADYITNTQSLKSNHKYYTPDFSYLFVYSI